MIHRRAPHPDVEVHLPFGLSLTRGILEGVNRFRAEHPDLVVQIYDSSAPPEEVRHCRGVVVFGRAVLGSLGREVRATVNLSNRKADFPTHSVVNDDYAVGRMAADHFLERGFVSFAFVGLGLLHFSTLRFEGFRDRIRECAPQALLRGPLLEGARDERFLGAIPKPCAVLAASDQAAARTVDMVLGSGFRVPDDFAVLGVDDDPVRCAMSRVELSSVRLNSCAQGYHAMELLMRLMGKRRPPKNLIIESIPPMDVTTRLSTNAFAHPHPGVANLFRVLRDRVHQIEGVDALAAACGMGKRTLERLLKEQLHSTPILELQAGRFRLARALLMQTGLSVERVAERAGYADLRTLVRHSKRHTGLTPLALRRHAKDGHSSGPGGGSRKLR